MSDWECHRVLYGSSIMASIASRLGGREERIHVITGAVGGVQ